jgi:DNA-directed RNA polymerase subunit RPC12/RpoP
MKNIITQIKQFICYNSGYRSKADCSVFRSLMCRYLLNKKCRLSWVDLSGEKTTRFIEQSNDWSVWKCENCGDEWAISEVPIEEYGYNYCPKCGAKITEYVNNI